MMRKKDTSTQFAVIGLGRFGQSIVKQLSKFGVNVLACDLYEEKLQTVAAYATHVAQVDASDEQAMKKLGLGNFDVVILAMGEDFKASLLATLTAKESGSSYIVVKAYGEREKKIIESIGADLVVIPEMEMGAKLAYRLMKPNVLDLFENQNNFLITEMNPLEKWVGKTVAESDIRRKHGMSLLAIIRGEKTIIPVKPDELLYEKDILLTLSDKNKDSDLSESSADALSL